MPYYATHIIMYIKFKDREQDIFPIYEDVILVEADDVEKAEEIAIKHGKDSEGDSNNSLKWEGYPSTFIFGGIRKIIECNFDQNLESLKEGIEVTYSQMELKSKENLDKLINGEEVNIKYLE